MARLDEPLRGRAVGDLDHPGAGAERELVEAVLGGDHQRPLAAEPDQRLGDRLLVVAVGDPEQLPVGAGRIGQRPEQLKIVRTPSALRAGITWAIAAWWRERT